MMECSDRFDEQRAALQPTVLRHTATLCNCPVTTDWWWRGIVDVVDVVRSSSSFIVVMSPHCDSLETFQNTSTKPVTTLLHEPLPHASAFHKKLVVTFLVLITFWFVYFENCALLQNKLTFKSGQRRKLICMMHSLHGNIFGKMFTDFR